MNKNQLTMAIIGGVALVAVLGIGYIVYDQIGVREEAQMDLDAQYSVFEQNKSASRATEKEIRNQTQSLRDWEQSAYACIAGMTNAVRYAAPMIPSVFQQQMRDDVRRFEVSPAEAQEKIVASANLATIFGDFKDYIVSGKLPTEEKTPELQRQWGDVCLLVDTLLESGVQSLESVKVEAPVADGKLDAQSYVLVYRARPEALVKVMNALAEMDYFIAVDTLSFEQEPDPLVALLTGSNKKKEARSGRRRPRTAETEDAATKGEAELLIQSGTVTDPSDPLICTPFKVTMKVSTLIAETKEEQK